MAKPDQYPLSHSALGLTGQLEEGIPELLGPVVNVKGGKTTWFLTYWD
jgi:hypothetical protein